MFKLLAFCGRYGGFAPPWSLEADVYWLHGYAKGVAALLKAEAPKMPKQARR